MGKPCGPGIIVNKARRPAWLQRQALSPWRIAVTGRYFPVEGCLGRSVRRTLNVEARGRSLMKLLLLSWAPGP